MVSVTAAFTLSIACASATPTAVPSGPSPMSSSSSTSSATSTAAAAHPVSTQAPRRPVDQRARAVGFVDVRSVIPSALLDLRYATDNNFVGERLYPPNARCLVHESMAPGLKTAARALRAHGEVLVFWDCYRPHSVQQRMFEKVPNPAWVAEPGPYSTSHETGRSVDVTLAARIPNCPTTRVIADRCRVDMGTDFDSFTPRATAYATAGVSASARAARARLRDAMAAGGLTVYSGEWWHFDGPGADVRRPIIDVPVS
ncbi:D-alanyl-D-alanine dipeptidase [Gordonia sp. zg691]|uniref:D-alanyl-D-alanine dipeptidase n=1 Tax=Gordonia jinghuaiqii TaxID=2758710 RepID=A0A7D7R0F3_9ACTN|nr:M15 family metallopeptidase [Gordonia jinghuaiqii]MBD0863207.1 D-alanyl-D-alanine dipeptidase [Gordonia jinghuaiqii]MCR5980280.1 D-alanyl-D-alanine dipeptidase [Gordonia jinghuaiqii]QMT01971.1 D-alanyl-D-alanine dipeptidase [Gordonia jinghuaiqii]